MVKPIQGEAERKPVRRATGFKRIFSATGYALNGVRVCFRQEEAFRQELIAAIIIIPAALLVGQGGLEKSLLVGSAVLVLIVELINSGIEAVVDRIGPEVHDLSGQAKDLGAAAVMLSILLHLAIWFLILAY